MSNNGWPNDPVRTVDIGIPGVKDTGSVRAGDVAKVFQAFITDFHYTVERLITINGYRSRALNIASGGIETSNHRSATALDLNGYRHPYEPSAPKPYNDGFSAAQTDQIRRLLRKYQVIKWGMDFNWGYRDAMHFEIRGTPSDVAAVAARLTPEPQPDPVDPVTPVLSSTPTDKDTDMIAIAKLADDDHIWVGNGVVRSHIPNPDALKDLQSQIRLGFFAAKTADVQIVASLDWLGKELV